MVGQYGNSTRSGKRSSIILVGKVTNYVEGAAYKILTAARKANKPWSSFKASPIFKDFDLRNRINHLKDKGNFMEYLYEL